MKRILIFSLAVGLFACKKESIPVRNTIETKAIEKNDTLPNVPFDTTLEHPGGRSLRTDPQFFKENQSKTKIVLLDFDGYTVSNSSWNFGLEKIICKPSKLIREQEEIILANAREDYAPWNIRFTISESEYENAPADGRQRVIICDDSWQWFGKVGGVSYIGSMFWGDNTPCFVFSDLLGNNTKQVAEAVSHEIGHTIGLSHVPDWTQNCVKKSDYWAGTGNGTLDYANIMGVGYYRHVVTFDNQARDLWSCDGEVTQADLIAQALGVRQDKIGDHPWDACRIMRPWRMYEVLEDNNDVDMYEVDLYRVSAVSLISGGNTDFKIEVYGVDKKLQHVYQDMQGLNVTRISLMNEVKYRRPHFPTGRRVYIAVRRSNDDKGSYIPASSSTGGYTLQFFR